MRHTLKFLKALKSNNSREWMDAHKGDYQKARTELLTLAETLIHGLASYDSSVAELTPASCVFRINRDIRFSKDKSPYKTNMGIYITPGGRNSGCAGYYVHLQPQHKSFIAGGIYEPAPLTLRMIRQEIDYNAEELTQIMQAPHFRRLFGELQGAALKNAPRGYDAAHPHIALLRMKSFIATHPTNDSTVARPDFAAYVLEAFEAIVPLVRFLNSAIFI